MERGKMIYNLNSNILASAFSSILQKMKKPLLQKNGKSRPVAAVRQQSVS